jgi:hypothetical protein
MARSDQVKITVSGHVPAAPGTKLVVFSCPNYLTADADDPNSIVHSAEFAVVCWEIRRNNYDETWAEPVITEIIDDQANTAIVFPDGQIQFETPYADVEFEGNTLEEFEAFTDSEFRASIRSCCCMDCNKDLRVTTGDDDSPMLRDDVWRSIVPDGKGMLCREHMEKRLGRKLTARDIKRIP